MKQNSSINLGKLIKYAIVLLEFEFDSHTTINIWLHRFCFFRQGFTLDRDEAFQELSKEKQQSALEYIETMNIGNISLSQFLK